MAWNTPAEAAFTALRLLHERPGELPEPEVDPDARPQMVAMDAPELALRWHQDPALRAWAAALGRGISTGDTDAQAAVLEQAAEHIRQHGLSNAAWLMLRNRPMPTMAQYEQRFRCPECGGTQEATRIACIQGEFPEDTPWEQRSPWLSVFAQIICAGCAARIPSHLGQRWHGPEEAGGRIGEQAAAWAAAEWRLLFRPELCRSGVWKAAGGGGGERY